MIIPDIIAFVVAIDGIIFPAISLILNLFNCSILKIYALMLAVAATNFIMISSSFSNDILNSGSIFLPFNCL